MASSTFEKYQQEAEDRLSQIANVEFVTKVLDGALEEHSGMETIDHPDGSVTTSKIRDQNVTHEKLNPYMNLLGKTVLVSTPTIDIVDDDPGDGGGDGGNHGGGGDGVDMQFIYGLLTTLENSLKQYTRTYTEQYTDGKVVSYDDETIRPYTDSRIDEVRTEMDSLLATTIENNAGTLVSSKEYTDEKYDELIGYSNSIQTNSVIYTDAMMNNLRDLIDRTMEVIGMEKEVDHEREYTVGDTFSIEDFDLTDQIDMEGMIYDLGIIIVRKNEYEFENIPIQVEEDFEPYRFMESGSFTIEITYINEDTDWRYPMIYRIKVSEPDSKSTLDTMKERIAEDVLSAILSLRDSLDDQDTAIDGLSDDLTWLSTDQISQWSEINRMKMDVGNIYNGVFSDVTTNPFSITFEDDVGWEMLEGVWNESYGRIEF